MWFLELDTLLLIFGACLLLGLAIRYAGSRGKTVLRLLPLIDLALLLYISVKFTLFYLGYVLVTYAFLLLLRRMRRGRGLWFAALCLGCTVPLVYHYMIPLYPLPTAGLTFVGIAYSTLKAIDALYYEYFAEEKIPLEIYANYMLFVPVLTAGPVFRYRDFQSNWEKPIPLTMERFTLSVQRIIRGLFGKTVIAGLLLMLLRNLMTRELRWYHSAVIPLISMLLLFWDMKGYADIAIGIGSLVGFTVPENFKKPFQAPSFAQFWRNWHVTVSDWIREHVYVLLRGKKLNRWHQAGIAMVVMLLMELWHGFSMVYLVSGILLGLILAAENLFGLTTLNRRKTPKWYFNLRCGIVIYLFSLDCLLYTLTPHEVKLVIKGFLSVFGGLLS